MRRVIAVVFLSLLVTLGSLLCLSSFIAATGYTLGGLIPPVVLGIFLLLRTASRVWLLAILLVIGLVILFVGFTFFLAEREFTGSSPPPLLLVSHYTMTITPIRSVPNTFSLQEELKIHPKWAEKYIDASKPPTLMPPTRTVQSTPRGLALREIHVPPPEGDSSGYAVEVLADGTEQTEFLFWYADTETTATVHLKDLPQGAFYEAKHAANLTVEPYAAVEDVSWQPRDVREGARFSYLQGAFRSIGPIVRLLASLSHLSTWIFTILGGVLSFLTLAVAKPVIVEMLQKYVKKSIERTGTT